MNKWKVRTRLVAEEQVFEVYRKTKDGEEYQGVLYPTQKEAYELADRLNGKEEKECCIS